MDGLDILFYPQNLLLEDKYAAYLLFRLIIPFKLLTLSVNAK